MSDLHLKDVKDDLIHEPGWVYLYAALLSGSLPLRSIPAVSWDEQ